MPRTATLPLAVSAAWGSRLGRPAAGHNRSTGRTPGRGDRFPSSTREPRPRSRHLHAGHHLASQQAPARLIPGRQLDPGFDLTDTLSTPHQWFAFARLRDPHLTHSMAGRFHELSTPALDRRTSRWFAASPCRATAKGRQTNRPGSFISRAAPHPSDSASTQFLLPRSRRTVVGISDHSRRVHPDRATR